MSSMHEPALPPLWHRHLPKPAEQLPSLRRTTLLAQHHIFHDQRSAATVGGNGVRRNSAPSISNQNSERQSNSYGVEHGQRVNDAENENTLSIDKSASLDLPDNLSDQEDVTRKQSPREHICLCPPDPRIPRPRNSFILFRQHQHASIVAQNPGLPNPEISKIIGEQWRQMSTEEKESWSMLAEEEKARHQQQYPGYRYHPRRNGRLSAQSSFSGPSSAETPEPCSKCGGKPMNTPSYRFAPSVVTQAGQPQQQMVAKVPAKRGYVVHSGHASRPGHPTVSPEHPAQPRGVVDGNFYTKVDPRLAYSLPLLTPANTESHESKRRRFNSSGTFISAHQYHDGTYQHSPVYVGPYPRADLAQSIQPQHIATQPTLVSPPRTMYPHPPQLQPVRPPNPPHTRTSSTVALPPIETMVDSPSPKTLLPAQTQRSGVEAMILSIPVLNRIKVLGQMSAPLQPPILISPKPEVRGAIIAIEGLDSKTVESMTHSLAEQLSKNGKFAVRIFNGPDPYDILHEIRHITDANGNAVTTERYLNMMTEWHAINKEMVDYISSRPGGKWNLPVEATPATKNPEPDLAAPECSSYTLTSASTRYPGEAEDLVSPKTVVPSSAPPQPALYTKTRSYSIPGLSTRECSTTTVPEQLTFPRPENSKRIPPPAPIQPPTHLEGQAKSHAFFSSSYSAPATTPLNIRQAHVSTPTKTSSPYSHAPHPDPSPNPLNHVEHTPPSVAITTTTIPIALVPHYQLTTVDACSISCPILDGYSPPSHWQWFGSLWRGCVGPDVTVVIRGAEHEGDEISGFAGSAIRRGMGQGQAVTGTEQRGSNNTNGMTVPGGQGGSSGVEVRLNDYRAVVVKTGIVDKNLSLAGQITSATGFGNDMVGGPRQENGDSAADTTGVGAKEVEFWEKAKRRVGFEVEEFLRR